MILLLSTLLLLHILYRLSFITFPLRYFCHSWTFYASNLSLFTFFNDSVAYMSILPLRLRLYPYFTLLTPYSHLFPCVYSVPSSTPFSSLLSRKYLFHFFSCSLFHAFNSYFSSFHVSILFLPWFSFSTFLCRTNLFQLFIFIGALISCF